MWPKSYFRKYPKYDFGHMDDELRVHEWKRSPVERGTIHQVQSFSELDSYIQYEWSRVNWIESIKDWIVALIRFSRRPIFWCLQLRWILNDWESTLRRNAFSRLWRQTGHIEIPVHWQIYFELPNDLWKPQVLTFYHRSISASGSCNQK